MKGKHFSSRRRRFTSTQRSGLLARYQRSGLTQRAFVQKHGVSLATLTNWLRRDRPNQDPSPKVPLQFQSVDLSHLLGAPGWAAEVALADGATLRLSAHASPALAGQLLQTLRRSC